MAGVVSTLAAALPKSRVWEWVDGSGEQAEWEKKAPARCQGRLRQVRTLGDAPQRKIVATALAATVSIA